MIGAQRKKSQVKELAEQDDALDDDDTQLTPAQLERRRALHALLKSTKAQLFRMNSKDKDGFDPKMSLSNQGLAVVAITSSIG